MPTGSKVAAFKTTFYCTFGNVHLEGRGGNCYVEVEAADSALAHEAMYEIFRGQWAFCYDAAAFRGQSARFNLKCIGKIYPVGDTWKFYGELP